MQIRLDRLGEERFEDSELLDIPALDLDEPDLVELSEIRSRVAVDRVAQGYLLNLHLDYLQKLCCVRCLREIEQPMNVDFELLVTVDRKVSGAGKGEAGSRGAAKGGVDERPDKRSTEEVELAEHDLSTLTLAEPILETRPIVLEQLHLGVPMKPLCKPECAGLCNRCGADLNEGPCPCGQADDPRWTKLKMLRGPVN